MGTHTSEAQYARFGLDEGCIHPQARSSGKPVATRMFCTFWLALMTCLGFATCLATMVRRRGAVSHTSSADF